MLGVQMGMFEQSMLFDTGTGKRTGAVAASLTLQTLLVAILIVIPLLYSDRLPLMKPWLSITIPVPHPLPEAPPEQNTARSPSSRPSLLPTRVFHPLLAPTAIPSEPAMISDEPASLAISTGAPTVPGFGTNLELSIAPAVAPGPVRPVAEPVKTPAKPVPQGGDVQAAKLIRKVIPAYPELARRARVSGTVRLVGVIAKDGTIEQLQVVSGNPLLVGSAVAAVRQWIYRPTMLDGQAVEVIAPIDVIFTLAQ
jgi:periplasmic protein TonB